MWRGGGGKQLGEGERKEERLKGGGGRGEKGKKVIPKTIWSVGGGPRESGREEEAKCKRPT